MNSQKKYQYTVTEDNNWEGETYRYIIEVTQAQSNIIQQKCELLGEGCLTIKQTSYNANDVNRLNEVHRNGYMDYIGFYKINYGMINKWKEYGDLFYKGKGLTLLKDGDLI